MARIFLIEFQDSIQILKFGFKDYECFGYYLFIQFRLYNLQKVPSKIHFFGQHSMYI